MNKIGLVLEGGGMRGLYTAGVLDFFLDKEIFFPYVIGVSAGACNAASYMSKQRGRNKAINIGYIDDPRYLSYRNLIREKSIFGMQFLFDEIPNKLVPFDYDSYYASEDKFVIGTTECVSGKPVYFYKEKDHDLTSQIKASSSLPFMSQVVNIDGKELLDGGISDPIPIKKSIEDGNVKNVVVLTRNEDYRKKPFRGNFISKKVYRKYQGLIDALDNRHSIYNDTLDYVEKLKAADKAFVIRPTAPINVSRIEKDKDKLTKLYDMGYNDASSCYSQLKEWISK